MYLQIYKFNAFCQKFKNILNLATKQWNKLMKLKQNLFNNENDLPRIAGHQAISKPDKFTNSVSSFIIWSGSFHTVG